MKKFKRILVANRGEIAIRVFRACKEMGIRSVAVYSEEDKNSLFRTVADESYQIGKGKTPVDAYLSINEIIGLAKAKGVSDQELQDIVLNVVMLKTDVEAKFQRSWYDIWNGNLKPYILEKLAQ